MAYTAQEWRDDDADTPLSAERLTHMENGIAAAVDAADDAADAVAGAKYSAEPNTLVIRNSAGSFSVPTGAPQYGTSPVSWAWLQSELKKRDERIAALEEQVGTA